MSVGNNGPVGGGGISTGGAAISTSVNGVTTTSGKGGNGQNGGATGGLTAYAASAGVTLVIPELETTYGFAGGGGGGIYKSGANYLVQNDYINLCATNLATFGSGAGGISFYGENSLATSGVSYTGVGGGGKSETAGGSFAGWRCRPFWGPRLR